MLLLAHAALITAGYTIGDRISLPAEVERLWTGYPGVVTATAGLAVLVGVVVTSVRWNPVWANDPGAVVARLVAPVEANADSDASHYSRLLRVHLGLVAEALQTAGRWPVALPALLRAAQRPRFTAIAALAREHSADVDLATRPGRARDRGWRQRPRDHRRHTPHAARSRLTLQRPAASSARDRRTLG
jgi:hypothetical protein